MPAGLRFRLLRWPQDSAEIETSWRALEARLSPFYFQRFEWFRCTASLGPSRTGPENGPRKEYVHPVGLASLGATPVGIFPLRRRTLPVASIPLRVLELPRDDHSIGDWLLDVEGGPPDLVTRFAEYLARQEEVNWDCLFLSKAHAGSGIMRSLAARRAARTVVESFEWIDFLRCRGTWEEFLSRLSRNFRANLRKARNRLGDLPGVEFRSYVEGADLEWALGEFARIESSGWKGKAGGAGILTTRERHARYLARAHVLSALRACRVDLLFVQGKAIAGLWGAVDRGSLFLHLIGYDEEYARLAPGNMLLEHLVKGLQRDSAIGRIDLASAETWHENWKPERYPLSNVYVFNGSLRGRLAHLATAAKLRLKSLRNHGGD